MPVTREVIVASLLVLAHVVGCKSRTDRATPVSDAGAGNQPDASRPGDLALRRYAFNPDASSAPFARPCEGPHPYIDAASGFVACANGSLHRPQKGVCPSPTLPRARVLAKPSVGKMECARDADCREKRFGRCEYGTSMGHQIGTRCTYGCTRDEECAKGWLCVCGEPAGQCQRAHCSVDSDCGDGLLCASFGQRDTEKGFACQTPADECGGDNDCARSYQCLLAEGGRRTCGARIP
jgi:hypothetical protein